MVTTSVLWNSSWDSVIQVEFGQNSNWYMLKDVNQVINKLEAHR